MAGLEVIMSHAIAMKAIGKSEIFIVEFDVVERLMQSNSGRNLLDFRIRQCALIEYISHIRREQSIKIVRYGRKPMFGYFPKERQFVIYARHKYRNC